MSAAHMSAHLRLVRARAPLTAVFAFALSACGGGGAAAPTADTTGLSTGTPGTPAPAQFTSVTVTPASASLVVDGTVPLTATPHDQNGRAMSGFPAATWTSSNDAVARVSATGVVSGVAAGTATITATIISGAVSKSSTAQVTVSATAPANATVTTPGSSFSPSSVTIAAGATVTWQFSGATHNVTFGSQKPEGGDIPDTSPGASVARTFGVAGTYAYLCTRHNGMSGQVVVQATGAPGQFASLTLTPESAFVTPNGTVQLTATPRDGAGTALSGLGAPAFTSTNAAVATVSASGVVTGVANGTASIIASLTVDGVTRADTSAMTVGTAAGTVVTSGNAFSPDDLEIAPGGTVVWQFNGTHNVTFDDDEVPPGGNIPTSDAGTSAARTFPQAGTYDYECTLHSGMKGRIRVR